MSRNLSCRVEVVAPVMSRHARARLWEALRIALEDHRTAWRMNSDGSYTRLTPPAGATEAASIGTHETLMRLTRQRAATSDRG
jgi:polyphosphate kinase